MLQRASAGAGPDHRRLDALRLPACAGRWKRWYTEAIPRAEQLYETYLKERGYEEDGAAL
jgi:hypothetical protein